MLTCNRTLEFAGDDDVAKEQPLWHNFTFHHFGLILTAAFGLVAVLIALFLIIQHARHYSKPWEQRHIIRILFMIPVYAIVSILSYLFYRNAIYWQVIRDCYEAFALASFFTLLCHYLEPTLHEQKNFFRQLTPRNWVWPLPWFQRCTGGRTRGPLRTPRSGLTWFNIIWVGVFQYCFIRVLFTFVAFITQIFDRYCESSLNPAFAHIWVMVFEGVAVSIAMYCIIQFYLQLKGDLAMHKPFMKVLCIKLVIFFSFWQSLLISFLSSSSGPLKPNAHIAYPDINIGIPSLLLCIEMAIFAVLHLFAFRYSVYVIRKNPGLASDPSIRYRGFFPALLDACNPWDIVKALGRGFRWAFVGYKNREMDESYKMAPGKLGSQDLGYGVDGATEMGKPSMGSFGGKNALDDTAGLLSNAQFDPHAATAYRPAASHDGVGGHANNVYDAGDAGLTNSLSRDDYLAGGASYPPSLYPSSYPPSYPPSLVGGQGFAAASSRDHSPYRYDEPRGTHSVLRAGPQAQQGAAHAFAGIHQPPGTEDEYSTGNEANYHAMSIPPAGPGKPGQHDWNSWRGGAAAPGQAR